MKQLVVDILPGRKPYNTHLEMPPKAKDVFYNMFEIEFLQGEIEELEDKVVADINLSHDRMEALKTFIERQIILNKFPISLN